ncbi:Sec-independent protein translocase protein TatB [Corynebacterium aquilae]|uniref:Sec-independent protein translocase protein TatB n=1 Tax=Corynebacterium aquilae DSM 44791 TaxID=1431546 RepID=A0A1L7CFD7_9CORY|nr:Sec-independent protein translocase protein TatB [Corynebacterium aquilae]APT84493.1 hypothetical protein CAQU_04810 [Corynebacterium aquilae DSM 44791]
MFTNLGWTEIMVVFIVGLIVIGPERLPRVIEDARAAIYAARTAIDNAKKELAGELGPEFDSIAEPLRDLNKLRGMTPRAVVTRTLLDGDDSFLDSFDPKKIMSQETAGQAVRKNADNNTTHAERVQPPSAPTPAPQQPQPNPQPPAAEPGAYDEVI